MQQRIIVIGQGYTGRLSIIRSAAQIGCVATVIALVGYKKDKMTLNTAPPLDTYSRYVDKVHYCYGRDKEGLVRLLLNECRCDDHKPIIFPDNDFSASVIDDHYDVLKDYFLMPSVKGEQGAVTRWMNKERQKALAKQLGMNVASSQQVKIVGQKFELPDDIVYPCFVKPLSSINGGKSALKRCDTQTELVEHLTTTSEGRDMRVMIEEYKKISDEYAVLGFSDGRSATIPGILKILKIAHGSHFGVAIQGSIMPCDGFEELMEKFKSYILEIGYVGVFDFDFYRSDDKLFFGELNLRFGGSGYAYTKMGANLPAMMIRHMRGEDWHGLDCNISERAVYVNDRMLRDEWMNGFISTKEYRRLYASADFSFIDDDIDNGPQQRKVRMERIDNVKHFVKKIIHKI